MADIQITKSSRIPRVDGPLKVTGSALYTSDYHFPRMVFAVPVCAKVGKGKIAHLDVAAAKAMKGVLDVYTRSTIGTIYRVTPAEDMEFRVAESRPPLEDDEIYYYGQYVALAVAETFELAQSAARAVKVRYESAKPHLGDELKLAELKKTETERGDAEKAFSRAEVKIDQTYVTPMEVHNPIEMHATVALWEAGDKVKIYETSQSIHAHRNVLAQMLGLPRENVEVISKFLGSGFGGKLWAWPHSVLAASAARNLRRPVKLVLDRSMMFNCVGHRPRTEQRIQLGAGSNGKLEALLHSYSSQASMLDDYKENCGEVSGFLYAAPDVSVKSAIDRRNVGTPTSMRGPGAVPGLFALESGMDELAVALKMDPVELRIKNDTLKDLAMGKDFSSRHFKECFELGAEKFGWGKRSSGIGSMKDGDETLGWGVAACTWQAQRLDAEATAEFLGSGRLRIRCGTHDIGTGMYTVLAQIAHEETGVPFDKIEVQLGDTALPAGPLAGGSMATGSVVPAVVEAIKKAEKALATAAAKSPGSPLHGKKPEDLKFAKGLLHGEEFGPLMRKMNMASVMGHGSAKGNFDPETRKAAKFSTKSFGAHFVEIGWNPGMAKLRVRRVVTVIDAGRIINFQPARNQIEGAIVMGIGMGMLEQAEFDARDGNVVNSNLADYIMAVHADCPEIDVTFLDYPDKAVNDYGARGVGEIGLAGVAAAITNGVYHATGVRVRELPVTIEKLLV